MREHFVGVAASDVEYNNLAASAKSKAEFSFLLRSLNDGDRQLQQGIFAVSSSGRYLGKVDTGWPTYHAEKSLKNLIEAKNTYMALPKKDRVGDALTEEERSLPVKTHTRLSGLTKLTSRARHYNFAQMELFDMRHPQYSKRGAVHFSEQEIRAMVPGSLVAGKSDEVDDAVIKKLLLKNHFQFGCEAWWEEHIRERSMKVTVEKKQGSKVFLNYTGSFTMKANSKWNKSSLVGCLLGKGIWNSAENTFDSLEIVSLSDVELGELKSNMHRGEIMKTNVACFLNLEKAKDNKK